VFFFLSWFVFWTHCYLQTGLRAAAQCIQRLNTCGILWSMRGNIGKVWLAWHSPHVKRCEDGECAKGEIIEWKKHRVITTKTLMMGYSEVLKGTQGAKSGSFHNRLKQLKGIQTDCNRTKDPEMLGVLKLFAFYWTQMLITVITRELQSYPRPHRSSLHSHNLLDNALKHGERKRPEPRMINRYIAWILPTATLKDLIVQGKDILINIPP
jgi:hypothetical protein